MLKILVPLDGSPFAEHVLSHLPALTVGKETEVFLLQVIETNRYQATIALETFDAEVFGRLREEIQRYLKTKAQELREQGYHAHAMLAEGDVAWNICEVADAQDVDLIAMTTHGRTGLERLVMGSVADRVIRAAKQPVYLVRPDKERVHSLEMRRILVPLDGSELAELALVPAKDLARFHRATLLLVQVIEPIEFYTEGYIYGEAFAPLPATEELEQTAREYLTNVAQKLREEGFQVETLVLRERAPEGIVKASEEQNADLVVMTTHGRSGLSRWVFGSVAEKVLRLVRCPLLLVRAGAGHLRAFAPEAEAEA